ncbi:nucleoprotein TPR-like, partial [Clarias magur]
MKYLPVVMVLVVAFTLGLLGLIHTRRNVERQLTKTSYFESVKHRVTVDVLKEFKANIVEANSRIDRTKKEIVDLTASIETAQVSADEKKTELNTCTEELLQLKTASDAIETERNRTVTEFLQLRGSFTERTTNIKILAEKRSRMCDYIIKSSVEG